MLEYWPILQYLRARPSLFHLELAPSMAMRLNGMPAEWDAGRKARRVRPRRSGIVARPD